MEFTVPALRDGAMLLADDPESVMAASVKHARAVAEGRKLFWQDWYIESA
jgi:hypothetical protein